MSLFETVSEDIKKAMLAKEKEKLEALRSVKAAFLLARTETGAGGELSSEAELKIVQKLVKQRRESAEIYQQQNRPDLADKELLEASVIEQYLPAQMSELELETILKAAPSASGPSNAAAKASAVENFSNSVSNISAAPDKMTAQPPFFSMRLNVVSIPR